MVSEGDLLAGKYRVERVLGEGGMGYVVAAMHEHLEQRVAVKLLVPELAEDQDAAARFLREARAAVRIQSEHVARVLDVGELDNGAPYMVMEFLSGRDLARELVARGTFETGAAIDYVLQASEAVAEAHAIGVIHRDLKPANLFLTRRADGSPLVKVLDFGISKALASSSGAVNASLTAAHSLLGSPAYMSPEQARRPKEVDIRTDIWSLGVILYEFLTGDTPFHGEVPLEVITAALSDPMPSIAAVRSDVPRELERVVEKCMEKKPGDRYQTVAEFAEALRPFAPGESMRSISRISGIIRSSAPPPSPDAGTATLRSGSAAARTPPEVETALGVKPAVTRKDAPGARDAPARRTPRGHEPTELAGDSVPPPTRAAKDTQTDWGRSQPASSRSRRRMLVVAGGTVAASIVGVSLALRLFASGPEPSTATEAAASSSRVSHAKPHEDASGPARTQPAIEVTPGAPLDTMPSAARPASGAGAEAPAANASSNGEPRIAAASASAGRLASSPGPVVQPMPSERMPKQAAAAASKVAPKFVPQKRPPEPPHASAPTEAEDPLENRH
jgi:serine/threonine-protein kinase